jgi:high-affinity iron transporter
VGSALIIVWRESIEAVLVVGILHAWLKSQGNREGLRWLVGGVVAGLGAAVALGASMLALQSQLAADVLEAIQTLAIFVAAALIVQMILWMRTHARGLKRELESGVASAVQSGNLMRVAILAAIAVAREGAETVLFLYGLLAERGGAELARVGAGAGIGLVLALVTFWLLSRGVRWMSWRAFFAVSEILLLLFAGALVVAGIDRLVAAGTLALDSGPRWDTTWLLDDASGAGGLLAQLTGYRAQPNIAELAALAAFWIAVLAFMHFPRIRLALGRRRNESARR